MAAVGKSWAVTAPFREGFPVAESPLIVPTSYCLSPSLPHSRVPPAWSCSQAFPSYPFLIKNKNKTQYLPPTRRIKSKHLQLINLSNSGPNLISHCSRTHVFLPILGCSWVIFVVVCIQLVVFSESGFTFYLFHLCLWFILYFWHLRPSKIIFLLSNVYLLEVPWLRVCPAIFFVRKCFYFALDLARWLA